MFPEEPIAVLIAGMHLYGAKDEERAAVIEALQAEKVKKIMPVHCTGLRAIIDLKQAFGDDCVVAMAGDTFRDF